MFGGCDMTGASVNTPFQVPLQSSILAEGERVRRCILQLPRSSPTARLSYNLAGREDDPSNYKSITGSRQGGIDVTITWGGGSGVESSPSACMDGVQSRTGLYKRHPWRGSILGGLTRSPNTHEIGSKDDGGGTQRTGRSLSGGPRTEVGPGGLRLLRLV